MATEGRLVCGAGAMVIPAGLLLCVLSWRPDLCDLPTIRDRLCPDQPGQGSLEQQVQEFDRRYAAKQAVEAELAAGRLSLLEAAAHFRALDHTGPPFNWEMFHQSWPGQTDDESHCREVIERLKNLPPSGCYQREELVGRLEDELRENLTRGTLRLPDIVLTGADK
jgi:hypothetical protein